MQMEKINSSSSKASLIVTILTREGITPTAETMTLREKEQWKKDVRSEGKNGNGRRME